MEEIWRFSHSTTLGRYKNANAHVYYSNFARRKVVHNNGKVEITCPKLKGYRGEAIYVTIAKLFPEICGQWWKGCQVDHLDTNRNNNRADNLRCCTQSENMRNPLTRKHSSEAAKRRTGEKNSFYGKHHSDETKKRISEAKKGKTPWNKGLKRARN